LTVYLKQAQYYSEIIRYVLNLISSFGDVSFDFVSTSDKADLIWDSDHPKTQPIAHRFYRDFDLGENMNHSDVFSDELLIRNESGEVDTLASIFYMVNSVQEINPSAADVDEFGRFRYSSSYQSKHNCPDNNLVRYLMLRFLESNQLSFRSRNSRVFVSHDIDTLYGSLIQDGFWALKRGRIDVILRLIMQTFLSNPAWRNIDRIVKINSHYDIKSTFFWLVKKGMDEYRIKNADYHLDSELDLLKKVSISRGFENGLHKSTFRSSINLEFSKSPFFNPINRYHFLKYKAHRDWGLLSESDIKIDCSHGFAEQFGFRNSYGLPFSPYSMKSKKEMDIIQVPLNFMDTTFSNYKKERLNPAECFINFFEENKKDCIISLLWHNNYFSDYKYGSFLKEYKKIAAYIYELGIESCSSKSILAEYGNSISKSE